MCAALCPGTSYLSTLVVSMIPSSNQQIHSTNSIAKTYTSGPWCRPGISRISTLSSIWKLCVITVIYCMI